MDPERRLRSFDVSLIHDCDLRCRYCSTGYGRWGGPVRKMTPQVQAAAIDFMIESGQPAFNVSFSGGESLLDFPRLEDFIKNLLDARRGSGQKVLIEVATNGVGLKPHQAEFFAANRVSLCFSLDGPATVTNRNRLGPGAASVYDQALQGLAVYRRALADRGQDPDSIRAECTLDEKASLVDSVRHLFDLGFGLVMARPARNSPYTGWRAGAAVDNFLATFREAVREVLAPLDLVDLVSGHYGRMLENVISPARHLITNTRQGPTCGLFDGSLHLTADGRLSLCYLLCAEADDDYSVGDLARGLDEHRLQTALKRLAAHGPDCGACDVEPWCDKGCWSDFQDEHRSGRDPADYESCRLRRETILIIADELQRRYGPSIAGPVP
jgi:radical SAM protein with 4Fe4S-binding SPASM domain